MSNKAGVVRLNKEHKMMIKVIYSRLLVLSPFALFGRKGEGD